MYYYYCISSLGYRNIWWKEYLTLLQIFQFVIDLSVCWFCWISIYFIDDEKDLCHGTHYGAFVGIACITSYLFLFLIFYSKTYKINEKKD